MTKYELLEEINYWAESAEPQTEENIAQLYFHYMDMFHNYCNEVPEFEITSPKGHVELK